MSIIQPSFIKRNFEHDLSLDPISLRKDQLVRVALAALPFFTLYKPFAYSLNLCMGGARVITSCKAALGSPKPTPCQMLNVAAAVAGVAGTLFSHPLGMLIATLHDVLLDLKRLGAALKDGDSQEILRESLHILNDILYVSIFLGGGAEVVAAALSVQFLAGLHRAHTQFYARGEKLEAVSQLLMSLIRGHQAIRTWQHILIEKEIQKAKAENRPYLPLANRMQAFFANAGYRINATSRWTVRKVSQLLFSQDNSWQTWGKVALAVPVSLAGFFLSTPCYFIASYVGIGRFERIEATTQIPTETSDKVDVLFQNICGQNPWSPLTGGVAPPLETAPDGTTRADAILSNILQQRPDVYCGQEYDDLDTSEKIGQTLAQNGYTCIRDLGCHDPILNHSGLFMAVRGSADSIGFHPFKAEDTSGLTRWCDRGLLDVTVPLQNGKSLKIINLHLNSGGESDQMSRLRQLGNYVTPLMQGHATLAAGDSNLDTSLLSASQKQLAGLDGIVNALEGQVTCSDEGKHIMNGKSRQGCNECEERIDVALFDPEKVIVSEIKIQPGHSDHHLISLRASVLI